VIAALFWIAIGLLVYAQLGYPLLLKALDGAGVGRRRARVSAVRTLAELPSVSLIVAAYAEEDVIVAKVDNALGLDYPRELLEIVVACDGSPDATAERARAAGADLVLELPRGGKIRAQDAAVERSGGEIVAFGDANALWERGALRALVEPFADERVGYVCGRVSFAQDPDQPGTNQEGLYWRYEMAIRSLESRLASVTAGNGAIYATRRSAYLVVDDVMGHDLSFPFNMVKRGWRALYAPAARAAEKMVPSIEGEFARKRRMMSHAWPIVVRGGLLSPRGYPPLYALMIVSHRLLRYAAPFLHLLALACNLALLDDGAVYVATFAAQAALLLSALAAQLVRARPLLIARYYVLTNASIALGLVDWLVKGTPAGWAAPEGTR
jgi:hypothetical protein